MEGKEINFNVIDGIVALPLEEYSRLVRASEKLDVVISLFKSPNLGYSRDSAIHAVLNIEQGVKSDE